MAINNNNRTMDKSSTYTPLQLFVIFLMKNLKTIVEKCGISPLIDYVPRFKTRPKMETLCVMALEHETNKTFFVCQLFNVDKFGMPETAIKEAIQLHDENKDCPVVVVCPGLYPQIIDEVNDNGNPVNFLVVDGAICEYIPFGCKSSATNRTKSD
jgi:hypothetical protein